MKYISHFFSSIIFMILGIIFILTINNSNYLYNLYIIMVVIILEISFSFDNAIINAKILKTMNPIWQKIFIVVGMPIAVFGMRLIFPILLLTTTSNKNINDVINIAIYYPQQYQILLNQISPMILSFGSSFLLIISLKFFLNNNKKTNLINIIENNSWINYLKTKNKNYLIIPTIISIYIFYYEKKILNLSSNTIFVSYIIGIIISEFFQIIDDICVKICKNNKHKNHIYKGIVGFITLEIIDASFSLDGVIGAFAISQDILIITVGLSIGAMFVRSITLYLIKYDTLKSLKYIEHGAHYAIFISSTIMLIKIFYHLYEWIIALLCISIIIFSLISSLKKINN